MKKNGFEAISKKTEEMWYAVNAKYGNGTYTLGVRGDGKVVLDKGYTKTIAVGNREAQTVMKALLNA